MSKLKQITEKFYSCNNKIKKLIEFKKIFSSNPAEGLDVYSYYGVNSAIEELKSYVDKPYNAEAVTESGMDIINKQIISELKELVTGYESFNNELMTYPERVCRDLKLIKDIIAIEAVPGELSKQTGLFLEVFNSRIITRLKSLMDNLGIDSQSPIEWLGGILSELEEDNVLDLLQDPNLTKIDSVIRKSLPDTLKPDLDRVIYLEFKDKDSTVRDVVVGKFDYYNNVVTSNSSYSNVVNYRTVTNKDPRQILDKITNLIMDVRNVESTVYCTSEPLIADKYLEEVTTKVTELFNTNPSDVETAIEDTAGLLNYIDNLVTIAEYVIESSYTVHSQLVIYYEVMELLMFLVITDSKLDDSAE